MDTSEQYIKMCERAEEIQAGHSWEELDNYWCDAMGGGFGYFRKPMNPDSDAFWHEIYGYHNGYRENKMVWLPRQDQLQGMVGNFDDCCHVMYWWLETRQIVKNKDNDNEDYWGHDSDTIKTMEQVWLGIVMYRKLNKIWNGEEWLDGS